MKSKIYLLMVFFGWASISSAVIPLASTPAWESSDTDYSTGGALYDVTGDGWIDFCVGNGNDMASNRNAVYRNNSGTLEIVASWRGNPSGYWSHIHVADMNNDGRADMAVSYLGIGANTGPATLYKNTGTGLEINPSWQSTDRYNSFDCAFADVDRDGDLDLAVATGDAYNNIKGPAKIYRNNAGTLELTPYWMSTDSSPSDAIRWADINNDGYIDLIVGMRRKINVHFATADSLPRRPSWSTTDCGWVLRLSVGDYNRDGWIDLAVASNGQLGDPNSFKIFRNTGGGFPSTATWTAGTSYRYSSCVQFGDANNDGWPDLAAGGWWEPAVVYENVSGSFGSTPAWSYNIGSSLVCETVAWGDIRRTHILTYSDSRSGNGVRKLFYLSRAPIQSFTGITVNGVPVPLSDYCYDPLTGWVSLKNAPPVGTNNVVITYVYSYAPDLGVTNWVSSRGNFLFLNTTPQGGVESEESKKKEIIHSGFIGLSPNPFSKDGILQYQLAEAGHVSIVVYNLSGQRVRTLMNQYQKGGKFSLRWNGRDEDGLEVASGVYLIRLQTEKENDLMRAVLVR